MRNPKRMLALVAAFAVAIVMASALQAHNGHERPGSMMRGGMMSGNMMEQMSRMMGHCSSMMQAGPRGSQPNDQWRKDRPSKPEAPDKPEKDG